MENQKILYFLFLNTWIILWQRKEKKINLHHTRKTVDPPIYPPSSNNINLIYSTLKRLSLSISMSHGNTQLNDHSENPRSFLVSPLRRITCCVIRPGTSCFFVYKRRAPEEIANLKIYAKQQGSKIFIRKFVSASLSLSLSQSMKKRKEKKKITQRRQTCIKQREREKKRSRPRCDSEETIKLFDLPSPSVHSINTFQLIPPQRPQPSILGAPRSDDGHIGIPFQQRASNT